jgi:hypothetical protein
MALDQILDAYTMGKLSLKALQGWMRRLQKTSHSLSEGQRGLWALQGRFPTSSNYNIPVSFHLPSDVDDGVFAASHPRGTPARRPARETSRQAGYDA